MSLRKHKTNAKKSSAHIQEIRTWAVLCLGAVPESLIDLFWGDLNSQSEEKITEAFEQVKSHVFGYNRKAGVSRHQEGKGGMKD